MKLKTTLLFFAFVLFSASYNMLNAQTDILQAGNLESETGWTISYLNTPAGSEPSAIWSYILDAPTAGVGGNLHVTGLSNNSTVQYAIYQNVHLSKDSLYSFEGAFKAITMNNTWCEVFIGAAPVDGEDYGSDAKKIAGFGTWNLPSQNDGTFSQHTGSYSAFAPDTTGIYYLVLKVGSTSWDGTDQSFEIIVDELSLVRERVAPLAAFNADITTGYTPLTVNFTNETDFGVSYSWDFGDGSAIVTDENPVHVYTVAGTYTVSLTATNEIGDNVLVKENLITADPPEVLTGGGLLPGGNLEDESKWGTSILNSPAGSEPSYTWNYTGQTPDAGQGGCLYVSGLANNNTVQYAIYQQVNLSADSVYHFNGAFRDITDKLNQFWCEVYIGEEPIDGLDYGEGNTKIAQFSTWDGGCAGAGINGTFRKDGCTYGGFTPDTTGEYFFVLKLGSTDWEGKDMPFAILLDELSLTGERTKPYTGFSASNPVGFPPQNVEFINETLFATSYSWDFGDGSSLSNEENPLHEYTDPGQYTVTLTATNEIGDSVITKENFVKINVKPELPDGEMLYGGNMEDPNLWNISSLNETSSTTAIWNYTENTPQNGEGGSLYLSGSGLNNQSQYCIWQQVELHADSVYYFDAAFKALTELTNFWAEVFIGTVPPVDGEDYGDDSIKIAQFNTWAECTGSLVDGTYQNDGCILMDNFSPEETGTYYFAIKIGCIDWEGNPVAFEVLLDEVTLQESTFVAAPGAEFFTDVVTGEAPLTVYFTDLSENATEWIWNFGDGETSNEQHPSHTYTEAGVYTVTLIAINEGVSDTLMIEDLIEVTPSSTDVYEGNEKTFSVFPNPSAGSVNLSLPQHFKGTLVVNSVLGNEILRKEIRNGEILVQIELERSGIYLVSLKSDKLNLTKKIIVK